MNSWDIEWQNQFKKKQNKVGSHITLSQNNTNDVNQDHM